MIYIYLMESFPIPLRRTIKTECETKCCIIAELWLDPVK